MNAIIFQLKRAHLATTKACRWLIRMVHEMTPARFDIMMLLRSAGYQQRDVKRRERMPTQLSACCLAQNAIVEQLGLHKSTVSEALKRLEELGWIVRFRNINNRRFQFVRMTELGLERTWEACKILFRARALKQPVHDMVCELVRTGPFAGRFEQVWETINQLARWFGDTSTCTMYDRQVPYAVPPFTPLEEQLNRCFGPEAGCRLPDFVLDFLLRRGAIVPARLERGARGWNHRR